MSICRHATTSETCICSYTFIQDNLPWNSMFPSSLASEGSRCGWFPGCTGVCGERRSGEHGGWYLNSRNSTGEVDITSSASLPQGCSRPFSLWLWDSVTKSTWLPSRALSPGRRVSVSPEWCTHRCSGERQACHFHTFTARELGISVT